MVKKKVSKKRVKKSKKKFITIKDKSVSLLNLSLGIIWIGVLLASGIVLSGTRFVTPILILELFGMIGTFIVIQLNK